MTYQDYQAFSEYEIRRINQIIKHLNKATDLINDFGYITFKIAGTKHWFCMLEKKEEIFDQLSSDSIFLVPDKENYFDEYAIKIITKDEHYLLGYVPKTVNEELLYYINLGYAPILKIIKKDIVNLNEFIEILIECSF